MVNDLNWLADEQHNYDETEWLITEGMRWHKTEKPTQMMLNARCIQVRWNRMIKLEIKWSHNAFIRAAVKHCGVSRSTVQRYVKNKLVSYPSEER